MVHAIFEYRLQPDTFVSFSSSRVTCPIMLWIKHKNEFTSTSSSCKLKPVAILATPKIRSWFLPFCIHAETYLLLSVQLCVLCKRAGCSIGVLCSDCNLLIFQKPLGDTNQTKLADTNMRVKERNGLWCAEKLSHVK